jgi:hypothetical protein
MKNLITKWRNLSPWKRRLLAVLPVVALIGGLAWWYIDHSYPSWTEEVLLSDGRMLNVHRRQEYVEGYGVRRTWLTFSLPEMGGKQTWSEWMYPAIVDVSGGKVYVVGYTPGFNQFGEYLNPRFQLVAYRWENKSFSRIPLLDVPERSRKHWNVLYCSKRGENTNWLAKSQGWCGGDGQYAVGKLRNLDLATLQAGAEVAARRVGQAGQFSE